MPGGALEVAGAAAVPPPRRHPVVRADVPGHDVRAARGVRRRAGLVAVAAVLVAGVLAACGGSTPSTAGSAALTAQRVPSARGTCGARAGRPVRARRVVWIVMENQSYSRVIGSRCALPQPSRGRVWPGDELLRRVAPEPAELHRDDFRLHAGNHRRRRPVSHPLRAPSIFCQLGGGWQALEESMPSTWRSRTRAYAVRHNPAAYYTTSAQCCAGRRAAHGYVGSLGRVHVRDAEPLQRHALRARSRTATRWLVDLPAELLRSVRVPVGRDRGVHHLGRGRRLPAHTSQRSSLARHAPGTRSATAFDHYSTARARPRSCSALPRLGAAAQATSMSGAFGLG